MSRLGLSDRMKKCIWGAALWSFLVLSASPGLGCLNDGSFMSGLGAEAYKTPLLKLTRVEGKEVWQKRLPNYRKDAWRTPNTQTHTDLGLALTHTGQYQEALTLFKQVEKKEPGLYATAANLGTLFELTGDNSKALYWIREGIERNPQSHQGTEWLHVRILEAKQKLERNPRWLHRNNVLGVDLGFGKVPELKSVLPTNNLGKPTDAGAVTKALEYQLRERMQFVPAPDALVGALLFDYANFLVLYGDKEDEAEAIPIYELALKYGAPDPTMVKRRLDYYRGGPPYPLYLAGVVLSLVATVFLWRRYRGLFQHHG